LSYSNDTLLHFIAKLALKRNNVPRTVIIDNLTSI
jgi:hypothetical protein